MSGDEIKRLRATARLTQQALADLMAVHQVTIARWETGGAPITEAHSRLLRLVCEGQCGRKLPRERRASCRSKNS